MNPFYISRCKFIQSNKKERKFHSKVPNPQKLDKSNKDIEEEVSKNLETAERLGLQLVKNRKDALDEIRDQLLKGNI